jgi:cytidylate kinase
MAIITIRGQMGSGAPEIGRLIANKLQFDYVDREVIDKVAELLQGPKHDIEMKEMPPGSLSRRILEALKRAYPSSRKVGLLPRWEYEGVSLPTWDIPLDDTRYLPALKSVINDLAKIGSIVIRGRGSQFILKDLPEAVHVLVVASNELRVKRVMENLKLGEGNAKKEIARFDSSRREFIKRYFNAELEDPLDYDLVINTNHLTFEDAAALVITTSNFEGKAQHKGSDSLQWSHLYPRF